MLNVSNDFNEAYKNYEREIKMRIKINGVMYTDHDISSFSVDYGSFMGNSFGIGSTFTNSMKLTLCKIVEGLKQLDEVVPEMGIVMPDKTVEYVPLGVFVISEEVNIDRNDNKTVIECSDRMILMNEPYESKLKYPAPIRDVALEIANLSGMEVDKTSFSTIKRDVIDEPKNYTYREALGLIAQFMAGYMTFDRNGLLTIRYLVDKDYRITPKEYMLKGLEKNEILFRPAGIEVRTGQNEEDIMTVGKQKGSVIKLENTVMRRLLLDDMYTRIKDINFYPYTLKWRGNPAVEVGDWLRVTDTKGNVFKVPNLSYRLEYRGGLIATSTVETVASNEVKMGYRGVLDQTIHYVNNILEDGTGNHIYYGVEKPEYPKEGDTWFKKNGPDTEIYIYQKVAEPDVFDWVLQISSAVDDTIKEAIEELEKEVQSAKDKADEVAVGLDDVQKDADEAKANAEQAKVDAGKAITDANKALQETETAKADAQKAKEQSDKAIKDASSSMVTAKDALSKATENETSIGGLQVDIDKTKNELKTKANQSDLNTLKGTVTNQQTQITQNATDIKTKAEKIYVDTINNKVDKQQTQINQNSESIKLKAEKQEVTNLKNELDNMEIGATNTLVGSDNIVVGGLDFEDGSRNEYQTLNVGKAFQNNFDFGDEVTISFDIEAPKGVQTLSIYNTNRHGSYQIGFRALYNIPVGKSRQSITTKLIEKDNPTLSSDWIEFYSNYGTSEWYKITKIKIEKGNRPTDWSPAPEDLATADQVKDLSASIDIQAGQIELKADQVVVDNIKKTVDKQGTAITQNSEAIKLKAEKSQVDNLTGKVDKQQTEINQNAEQIKLKANQNVVDDINKKVTSQQAQIEVNKNNINLKTDQTEVDNVKQTVSKQGSQIDINTSNIKLKAEKSEVTNLKNELDGLEYENRNLYIDTMLMKSSLWNNTEHWSKEGQHDGFQILQRYGQWMGVSQNINAKKNEEYTLSAFIKSDTQDSVTFYGNYGNQTVTNNNTTLKTTQEWARYFVTFKAQNDGIIRPRFEAKLPNTTMQIYGLKLERGNKTTPWSPAPEDLATQSDVTKLEASINVEAGKITNLTSSVNKNSTNIGKLTIESNKISSQVVELQNEELGTTNLLRNTEFSDGNLNYWQINGDIVSQIDTTNKHLGKNSLKLIFNKVDANGFQNRLYQPNTTNTTTKMTSSVFVKANKRVDVVLRNNDGNDMESFSVGTGWQKISSSVYGNKFLLFPKEPCTLWICMPKTERGSKPSDWSRAPEDSATQSQITQLSDDILLRVQKGDVINQINISTEGILIDGAKTHITGQTTIDNAVIKDAMIANVSANKLTAGTIDANKINVINLNANNIATGTLNGIYINLDKTMTIAENGSINSSYFYGDDYAGSYNPRWFDGTSRYGNRYLNFLSNVYKVNSNNTKGSFLYYTEAFYGPDMVKLRQYNNTNTSLDPRSHLDITANHLLAGKGWGTNISIEFDNGHIYASDSLLTSEVKAQVGLFSSGIEVRDEREFGLETGRINTLNNYNTLKFNNKRTDLGDLELSKDSSGRRIQSYAVYSRTYGGGATVTVTDAGTLGRITSAAKYKLDIEDADGVMEKAFKVLEINPKMWFDKMEVESIAEAMTNDELHELEADRQIRRHHGFVADEFHEKGLDEVVIYDSKGEIEGLSYDRISMYHNVILKRQQDEIEALKRQVAELIGGGKHE